LLAPPALSTSVMSSQMEPQAPLYQVKSAPLLASPPSWIMMSPWTQPPPDVKQASVDVDLIAGAVTGSVEVSYLWLGTVEGSNGVLTPLASASVAGALPCASRTLLTRESMALAMKWDAVSS
jgi:hypothetical protein